MLSVVQAWQFVDEWLACFNCCSLETCTNNITGTLKQTDTLCSGLLRCIRFLCVQRCQLTYTHNSEPLLILFENDLLYKHAPKKIKKIPHIAHIQTCITKPSTRARTETCTLIFSAYTSATLWCCRTFPESQRTKWEVVVRGSEAKKSRGLVKWEGGRGWADDRGGSQKERKEERVRWGVEIWS